MVFQRRNLSVILFICVITNSYCRNVEREMTIKVKPGTADCFYEAINVGDELDLEYQVVNGEHGELDVDFFMYGLKGVILKADARKSDSSHRITMSEAGDYKFCWDNTFSRISTKTVFFALYIENPNDDSDDWRQNGEWDAEEFYEMKVEDIKGAVDRIRSHLTKSRFLQNALSSFEARDRNIAENNYTRINLFSCISVCVMLATGIVQVILLRSLFDEKSTLHKIWKRNEATLPRY